MKSKAVFEFDDYKDFIRTRTRESRSNWGAIRKLAEAAGCQRSYISQVLGGHAHLTKDQAFGLTRYLRLNEAETEYFLGLIELARCGSPSYRTHLEKKLKSLRSEHENLSSRIGHARPPVAEAETIYYSAWYWAAIHILTSIPGFQTVPAVSERLQLPSSLVSACLEKLKNFGMIEKERDRWIFCGNSVHLPAGSPLLSFLHQNWRGRAMLDLQLGRDDSIHYSSLHSLSRKAYVELKTLFQQAIEDSHRVSAPSACEELACVTIDLFRV